MTISPILPRGEAVPEGFTLPHNTRRTMADVWADEASDQRKRDRALVRKSTYRPSHVTPRGKIAFAGYDETEVQVRKFEGGKE